ncbi:MAG: winged helix-turn-helix transcriptional regulator [Ruminococcus sp.]|nr:winged helix-turn-helix transcriptional regulator [Ruminococcus sp.]
MKKSNKEFAVIFKALGDERRIQLLKLLKSGEQCACKLQESMELSQPTLSHHMKILCESGLVDARKEGKWMYYSISSSGAVTAIKCLAQLMDIN